MRYRIRHSLLADTFAHFKACGRGSHECQLVWTSAWSNPVDITGVIHPRHRSHAGGFELDSKWVNSFWNQLSRSQQGIRVQVHTHPREAFHSPIDDRYPIVHSVGFLSLVIPDFGLGTIGFDGAYLAEIQPSGQWRQVSISSRLEIC